MLYFRKKTAKINASRTIILFAGSGGFLPSMIITYLVASDRYA